MKKKNGYILKVAIASGGSGKVLISGYMSGWDTVGGKFIINLTDKMEEAYITPFSVHLKDYQKEILGTGDEKAYVRFGRGKKAKVYNPRHHNYVTGTTRIKLKYEPNIYIHDWDYID